MNMAGYVLFWYLLGVKLTWGHAHKTRSWYLLGVTFKTIRPAPQSLLYGCPPRPGNKHAKLMVTQTKLMDYRGPPKGGGGACSLVPNKIFLVFPCSPKAFFRFWCSLLPKRSFCSLVPSFIFLLFLICSQQFCHHISLFPETPGGPSLNKRINIKAR